MSMDSILAWNVRGLNRVAKQQNVRKFISTHRIALFGLLETKVKIAKRAILYQNLCLVLGGVSLPIVVLWIRGG